MAEPDLIDQYLAELRGTLSRRLDVDDLIDELGDHLREAAGRLCPAGFDPLCAQRQTLDRFGDAAVVARAFRYTPIGGTAMPTAFTRTAGSIALVTAALWLCAAAVNYWASGLSAPWTSERYAVLALVTGAAGAGTALVIAGLVARGGTRDSAGTVALVLSTVAVIAMLVMTWMWALWALFFAVAFLIVIPRFQTAIGSRRVTDWGLVVGWPIGFAAMLLTDTIGMGQPDSYGDYPLGQVTAFALLAALVAIGLVGVGRELRSERVAESVPSVS